MTDASATTVCSLNVPSLASTLRSSPRQWWRTVPSVIMPAVKVMAPRSHRFWWPVEQ